MKKMIGLIVMGLLVLAPAGVQALLIQTGAKWNDPASIEMKVTVTSGITGAGYFTDYHAYVNGVDETVPLFCVENEPADTSDFVKYELYTLTDVSHNVQAAWIAENYWWKDPAEKGQAQLAIWSLLDTIVFDINDFSQASAIFDAATPTEIELEDYTANWLLATNEGHQDYLIRMTSIPEPAPLLLLGTALVGLAAFGRRTFKR